MLSRASVEDSLAPATYWDARLDATTTRSVLVRTSGEEKVSDTAVLGVAVRALVDGAWGLASTDRADEAALAEAAGDAVAMARALAPRVREPVTLTDGPVTTGQHDLLPKRDPFELEPASLLALLRETLAAVPSRVEASARLGLRLEDKRVVGASGADVASKVVRLSCSIDLTDKASGTSVGRRLGGTGGFELVPPDVLSSATASALVALERLVQAKAAPREKLPVVIDPELTGVFAHEAVGHGCEADLVLAGDSLFADRVGERVGTEEVTIVDDPGRLPGFGAFAVDDEATLARPRPLVERGVVTGFIHSLETAARLGHEPNGGARAQDGQSEPMPRMSNTMFLGGSATEDELWEEAGRCIHVLGTRGGQVDTARGTFQFTPQEAYLVEEGEILHAIRGAGLSGTVLRTLKSVELASKTESLGGPGMCGKGQWVPVGDGGPLVLTRGVEVG